MFTHLKPIKHVCLFLLVSNLTHQWVSIRPAEIILYGLIIQTGPLVFFVVAWRGHNEIKYSSLCPPRELDFLISCTNRWCCEPTIDVILFLRGHDGHQVSSLHATVLLCHLPAQTLAEVSVTEAMKLIPAWLTSLHI